VAAVLIRVSTIEQRRRPGRLERTYNQLYQRLAAMVADGSYPFSGEETPTEDAPRVGDGLVVVETNGSIRFASPNAMSALHRMGVNTTVDNHTLSELGVEEGAVARALNTGRPVIEEIERRPDVIVLIHCIPLLDGSSVTGGMVLLRDVTDLRRLDRLLLTKDAAIREVHHRVKNNLQTISSLLRLQARRLEPGEAQKALNEAERRVRSIAVVHEVLSRDPGDEVPFADIVAALVRMAEDSVVGPDIEIRVTGDLGDVGAGIATPLAVVIAELIQNALEHGFRSSALDDDSSEQTARAHGATGHVDLRLDNDGFSLRIQVRDDGVGLPPDFDVHATNTLGLSIVRDLVESQLGGTITMSNQGGTVVDITILCNPAAADHAW
jgi:two-component sensor histidine kinase